MADDGNADVTRDDDGGRDPNLDLQSEDLAEDNFENFDRPNVGIRYFFFFVYFFF